jgi:hypothetical protein
MRRGWRDTVMNGMRERNDAEWIRTMERDEGSGWNSSIISRQRTVVAAKYIKKSVAILFGT